MKGEERSGSIRGSLKIIPPPPWRSGAFCSPATRCCLLPPSATAMRSFPRWIWVLVLGFCWYRWVALEWVWNRQWVSLLFVAVSILVAQTIAAFLICSAAITITVGGSFCFPILFLWAAAIADNCVFIRANWSVFLLISSYIAGGLYVRINGWWQWWLHHFRVAGLLIWQIGGCAISPQSMLSPCNPPPFLPSEQSIPSPHPHSSHAPCLDY